MANSEREALRRRIRSDTTITGLCWAQSAREVLDLLDVVEKELKRMRRSWRREANRAEKLRTTTTSIVSKERYYGEANVWGMCANRAHRLIMHIGGRCS